MNFASTNGRLLCAAVLATLTVPATAQQPASGARNVPQWVARSNQNTKILQDLQVRFSPEGAAAVGIEGVDTEISDLTPGFRERERAATEKALAELKRRASAELDPLVKQDLEILIKSTEDSLKSTALAEKHFIPYVNLPRMIFNVTRSLLDDQIAEKRRPAALVRLRKYAGLEKGFQPVTRLVEQDISAKLKNPKLAGPYRQQLEKELAQADIFINGIGELFEKYKIAGYEQPYAALKQQLVEYNDFVRKQVLPRARTGFRLPPEVYAHNLDELGIRIPPAELAAMAHGAFTELQNHMQTIAAQIARQRGFASSDYRDVIRELKKQQLVGDAILPHYQQRLKDIEEIVRREQLVTLPSRAARIRLASAAESAGTPAPNMRPPRLMGNTGEQGEFVLPLNIPSDEPGKMQNFDDFTFEAASWTLTAHEARPGHEMQFASVIESGVSDARALYAFNSTNVEGWGLYSEYILFPYMPLEGQLISLQHRMMRAARAFLDPELQMGKITPQQAKSVLTGEVVLSEAMANQEVERYTSRSPGQATSYFYGYMQLVQLRRDAQEAMGARFNQQRFHDFILAQGLLPPELMRKAVMNEFVAGKTVAASAN